MDTSQSASSFAKRKSSSSLRQDGIRPWRADTEVVSSCPSRAFMGSVYGPIGPKKGNRPRSREELQCSPFREWLGSLG